MTDEECAFLDAICANPDADGPRLVYADWLEEFRPNRSDEDPNGEADGDRAEFIRVQCELAKHPQQVEWLRNMPVEQWEGNESEGVLLRHIDQLVTRERELLDADAGGLSGLLFSDWSRSINGGWLIVVDGSKSIVEFARGFPSAVTCTLRDWVGEVCACYDGAIVDSRGLFVSACEACHGSSRIGGHGPAIVAAAPVTRVTLTGKRPWAGRHDAKSIEPMWFGWWHIGHDYERNKDSADVLPCELMELMLGDPNIVVAPGGTQYKPDIKTGSVMFLNEATAIDALSTAAIRWARIEADKARTAGVRCERCGGGETEFLRLGMRPAEPVGCPAGCDDGRTGRREPLWDEGRARK